METYIEDTLIHNMLVCLFAYYASSYMSMSKAYQRFFYIYLFIEQWFVILCFDATFYWCFYLFEGLVFLYTVSLQYKKALMYVCIKYMLLLTSFKLFGGSFHLLHYFVPSHRNLLGVWLLLGFSILVLKQKWGAYLSVSDLILPVTIKADQLLRVRGFLDTGNQMQHLDKPVLFLDSHYQTSFHEQEYDVIEVHTLTVSQSMKVYLCEVSISRYKAQTCYICCDKRVRLEWNCQCLLNFTLWE